MSARRFATLLLGSFFALAGSGVPAQEPPTSDAPGFASEPSAPERAEAPSSPEIADLRSRMDEVEEDLGNLKGRVGNAASEGLVLFLFGVFCALWAQNTGRNAWLWFFLGLFFSVVTVIVLLVKNRKELPPASAAPATPLPPPPPAPAGPR